MIKTENPLKQVLKFGQSLWYDGLISPKDFKNLIREDGIRGATTNPTIFEKALSTGEYDSRIRLGLAGGIPVEEIYKSLAVGAVQEVADVFQPVFKETEGHDGYVSIEVSPLLAYDTDATIREARELWGLVKRENVMIKVPATRQGVPAIRALIADGINVNVTLIFSIERYREVMNAYLEGLEDAFPPEAEKTGSFLSRTASVASFFVSRVDTSVDALLEEKIALNSDAKKKAALKKLMGRAAVANSKLAYREFEAVFGSARFKALEKKGAKKQRPLWASTGTKNPAYSDVVYVEALIGPETVDTMPPATLDAFRDHGRPASRVGSEIGESQKFLKDLEDEGIRLTEVTALLEEAGVRSFSDSYQKILKGIESKKKI